MRVLLVTWAGGGNVPPAVAIADQLVARGHRVRVLGHPAVKDAFPDTMEFRSYVRAPEFVDSRPANDATPEPKTPLGAFAHLRDRLLLGPSDRFALDVSDHITEFVPDVLVVDFMIVGGLVAGEARDVPTVALMHTIYSLPKPGVPPLGLGLVPATGPVGRLRDRTLSDVIARLWNRGLTDLNRARTMTGLAPVDDAFEQLQSVTHVLVASSPIFDFNAQSDATVSYVGVQRPIHRSGEQWQLTRTDLAHLPLVIASYSTTDQHQLTPLRRVAAALGRLPVRGLVTSGPAIHPDQIAAPPNVDVHHFVDHNALLPQSSLLISHGGHGSVLSAIAKGVPVLCIPQGRDQHDVAARLVHLGAGTTLPRRSTPGRIARHVDKLLHNQELRARARTAANHLATEDRRDPVGVIETTAATKILDNERRSTRRPETSAAHARGKEPSR